MFFSDAIMPLSGLSKPFKIMINMLRFVAQDQCFMKYAGQCETYATCPASWWGFTVTADPEDCCDCRLECWSMIRENNEQATNQWEQIQMKSQKVVFD